MATNFKIQAWNSAVSTYKKFDVVYEEPGVFRYHYATQPSSNQDPRAVFNFVITSAYREDDAAFVFYTRTGAAPEIVQGCLIAVTGLTQDSFNTTGTIIDAGPGWVKYLNEGLPGSAGAISVGAINCKNPAWTTGFMFVPSYSTSIEGTQNIIQAKFGDGYGQRQRAGINSNTQSFQLMFSDRSDREAKALFNYIEDKGGVDAIKLLVPINRFFNNHTLRFTLKNPKLQSTAYDLNSISVTADQVFDL